MSAVERLDAEAMEMLAATRPNGDHTNETVLAEPGDEQLFE